MMRSVDRILTTHAGSLPRPDELREAWARPINDPRDEAALQALLQKSVVNVVGEQKKFGVDIPNDGEFGKPMRSAADLAAWGAYIFGRMSGFGPTPAGTEAPDKAVAGQPTRIVGLRWEQREFPGFYAEYVSGITRPGGRPTCLAPLAYSGGDALDHDIANLTVAADAAGVKEAFVTSIAVGSLEMFCRAQNRHYPTAEKFLEAIALALRVEYRAIVDAGFVLQLDDPGLRTPGICSIRSRALKNTNVTRCCVSTHSTMRLRAFLRIASVITSAGQLARAPHHRHCLTRHRRCDAPGQSAGVFA
ncbi:MAG: hypothetical protein ACLPX7_02755 [Xanthobacteraceae bacterium]